MKNLFSIFPHIFKINTAKLFESSSLSLWNNFVLNLTRKWVGGWKDSVTSFKYIIIKLTRPFSTVKEKANKNIASMS